MAFRLLLKNDMKGSEPESITFVCSASSCIGLPRSSVRLVDWLLHFTFLYFLPKCLLLFVLFCFFVCLFVCLFVCFSQEMQIRAPFNVAPTPAYQPGLIYHNNAWKTPNQLVVESNVETENRPVEEKFPVSAGLDHQKTENNMDAQSAAQSINVFARFQVGLYVCVACDQVKSECT